MPATAPTQEITYDLSQTRAMEIAANMSRNGGHTAFVIEQADAPDQATIFMGDFPRYAHITGIVTTIGAIHCQPPMSLGAAVAEMERQQTEMVPLCILHWKSEPGAFRVSSFNRGVLAQVKPAITSFYAPEQKKRGR